MSDPAAALLLECRNLDKGFRIGARTIEVLRDVSFTVATGDFVALRGASGAGKSTLLHLLGGLDTPTGGEVRYEGRNLSTMSGRELARFRNRRIGFVFQAYHLLPEFDAVENVCAPARLARRPANEARAAAMAMLGRVGLAHRLDHRPSELSGGEQQRVAIARALVNTPDLLLADEPTGNLDSHTGQEIIDLLCDLQAERRLTLVIATHDTRVATRAPRVLELLDGRLANPVTASAPG